MLVELWEDSLVATRVRKVCADGIVDDWAREGSCGGVVVDGQSIWATASLCAITGTGHVAVGHWLELSIVLK